MDNVKVITTVGTSIFMNYMKDEIGKLYEDNNKDYLSIRDDFEDMKDCTEKEYVDHSKAISRIKRYLNEYWLKGIIKRGSGWELEENMYNLNASAEIQSLNLIQKRCEPETKILVELISTDTILSKVSAEIIKDNINNMNSNIVVENIHVIKGIQVNNYESFRKEGLQNLFSKLDELNDHENKTILNISGGYKVLIPYMSIYGQLYNIPVYYTYEDSNELIIINKLPVEFDWFFAERNYPVMEEPNLYEGYKEFDELKRLSLIEQNNNSFELTTIGKLYEDYIKKNMSVSKNIMGYFMEYKVYEFLINNECKNYKIVRHSVRKEDNLEKNEWMGDAEFDLILFKREYDYSDFIVGEVKSYNLMCKGKYKEFMNKQLKNQIEKFKESGNIPKEYHLYIYKSANKFLEENFKDKFYKIEKLINQNFNCVFKVFMINVNYTFMKNDLGDSYEYINYKNNENPYKFFMERPLRYEDIKEIKLD